MSGGSGRRLPRQAIARQARSGVSIEELADLYRVSPEAIRACLTPGVMPPEAERSPSFLATADERGRLLLAAAGVAPGDRFEVEVRDDGVLVLIRLEPEE